MSGPTLAIDIVEAIIELLNTDVPSDVPTATNRRVIPPEPFREPLIAVFLGPQPSQPAGGSTRSPIADRERVVWVQTGIVTDDVTQIDTLLELLHKHVVSKLGDTNLGGLATDVQQRGIVHPDEPFVYGLDLYNAVQRVRFDVRYQSARANLAAKQ